LMLKRQRHVSFAVSYIPYLLELCGRLTSWLSVLANEQCFLETSWVKLLSKYNQKTRGAPTQLGLLLSVRKEKPVRGNPYGLNGILKKPVQMHTVQPQYAPATRAHLAYRLCQLFNCAVQKLMVILHLKLKLPLS